MTTPAITDEQIAEIEALANAATQGTWELTQKQEWPWDQTIYAETGEYIVDIRLREWSTSDDQAKANARPGNAYCIADAEFIASSSPATILAIISRLRAAERDAARYSWIRDQHNDAHGNTWVSVYQPGGWTSLDSTVFGCPADPTELDLDRSVDAVMSQIEPNTPT